MWQSPPLSRYQVLEDLNILTKNLLHLKLLESILIWRMLILKTQKISLIHRLTPPRILHTLPTHLRPSATHQIKLAIHRIPMAMMNQRKKEKGEEKPGLRNINEEFSWQAFIKAFTCLKMMQKKCMKTSQFLWNYLQKLCGFGSKMPEVQEREETPCIPKPR